MLVRRGSEVVVGVVVGVAGSPLLPPHSVLQNRVLVRRGSEVVVGVGVGGAGSPPLPPRPVLQNGVLVPSPRRG